MRYSSTHTNANVIICGRGPHTDTPATAARPSPDAVATTWVGRRLVRARMNQKPAQVMAPKPRLTASCPPILPRPYMSSSERYSWSIHW